MYSRAGRIERTDQHLYALGDRYQTLASNGRSVSSVALEPVVLQLAIVNVISSFDLGLCQVVPIDLFSVFSLVFSSQYYLS